MWDDDRSYYDYKQNEPRHQQYEVITPEQKIYRFEFMPDYEISRRPVGNIRFSETELKQLGIAWLVLTIAFFMVFRGSNLIHTSNPVAIAIAAGIAVTTGFFLHELGHKITANRMGYWSEFRASYRGLLIAFFLAAIPPHILFAAPGAVMIAGNINKRENGIISIAGPGVNVVISAICLGALLTIKSSLSDFIIDTLFFVTAINLLLAGFNMIPIRPLDGSKILPWSPPLYASTFVLIIVMFYTLFFRI